MWIKTVNMNYIPNEELIEKGIDLADDDAIVDYFFEKGGEDEFHQFGEETKIVDRTDNFRYSS